MKSMINLVISGLLFYSVALYAVDSKDTWKFLNTASQPTQLFSIPAARVLNSMEVELSGGASFGVENSDALLQKWIVGLGGIAEVELSTSGMSNRMTGESEKISTSSFKVNLIPTRYKDKWFLPDLAVLLKSSSWNTINGDEGRILHQYTVEAKDINLVSIHDLNQRYSTLYFIAGKSNFLGSLQLGFSQTDVRTKAGQSQIYNNVYSRYEWLDIPEMQKTFLSPFGGIEVYANENTLLMAEVQSIPVFDYDLNKHSVVIDQVWLGIAGVRFLITNWLSMDTGVRYQSDDDGIADAEIDVGVNVVFPVYHLFQK